MGLIILAILFMPIAIFIRLDSQGPILYRQVRFGLGGQPFMLYKFRSMVANAEAIKYLVANEHQGHFFKNANDPRVTRVGIFLRRTSLDELPQFWNVFVGQMSLVGTRPPTLDEVQHYTRKHWLRLRVKPGLTGEWQTAGRSSINDFEHVVALDLRYQAIWTPWYDIWLLWKTLGILLTRTGSY